MANAIIAKGNATFSINPQETEARLVFTPDPEGEGWDAPAINKLASEYQLGAFSDPKVLEAFLVKASKAKTESPLEMVYVQGTEPSESQHEEISWETLPVPGDMAPYQKDVLDKAGEPEITLVKVEKIKREEKVSKPGALPFMAAKEEIAVSWEKKETREKVKVNPETREIMYVDKGAKLGSVSPPVPGKPGKSIFGRPVPPQETKGNTFFFGEGILRDKYDLYARVSGFVRIGENWADIVPFSKHSYQITSGIDGLTLFLQLDAGDPCFPPPRGEEILAAALEKGACESGLISAAELDKEISNAINSREGLDAFALQRVQEAAARVDMNQDKTLAVLYLRKGVAGALPLEMKAIGLAIKNSNIQGFDTEKLKTEIQAFMQGKELEFRFVLAEGAPSRRGKDKEVQNLASMLPEEDHKSIAARINKCRSALREMKIDPKKITGFSFVGEDTVIARVTEEDEGEEGKDIFGNVIPGFPGNDPDIRLFRGLQMQGHNICVSRKGLLILEASENSFHGEIIDYNDARIVIHVSDDGMEARGDFFREEGPGIPLNIENVKNVLTSLEIKKGINWEGVEKACALARAKGSALGHIVAKGEAPINKGASQYKWLVSFDTPELADSDEISAPAAKTTQTKAGSPILDISEPLADGRPGYDIRGNQIPIDNEAALSIEHDNSIRAIAYGKGKRLIAARSGELCFYDEKRLKINSVKAIPGDAAEEIKFSGEIQISGNVLPGSKVLGASHIIVSGQAEEAFISAGGKAIVSKGFRGMGRGILRARAGIASAFVERAFVTAVGDIQLNKGSILSSIKTNGKLLVVAEDGKLQGGVCQARHGIDAANIGSEKGFRTEISFGQDYLLKNELVNCEEQIARLKQSLSQMEEKLKDYQQKKKPLPDAIKTEKIRLVKLQEQFNLKLFTLREKFEEHFDSEIRIRGTIFPGVVIESHNRYYEVKQKRSRVVFYFDRESGQIKEKPLS
jgi:hypothetical protein